MPMKAKSVCTLERAKRINIGLWMVAFVCSSPWLGGTVVRQSPLFPALQICDFRFTPDKYVYIFGSDILIFYITPLIIVTSLYAKIAITLRLSEKGYSQGFAGIALRVYSADRRLSNAVRLPESHIGEPVIIARSASVFEQRRPPVKVKTLVVS